MGERRWKGGGERKRQGADRGFLITCNLNMIKHDYSCNLRHKTLHLCACYHTLSAFLSFHANLCYNIKIH